MSQLTINEAARLLGISPQRVGQLIKVGKLPAFRWGRDWVIDAKDLKLLDGRRVGRPWRVEK